LASLEHRTYEARSGSAPHPALILLHGFGSNEMDLPGLAVELDSRFYTISVRAPFEVVFGGYQWFPVPGMSTGDPSQLDDSLARLQAFLNEATAAYPIDPARVFLLGFSQGAFMSGLLTIAQPEKIAGAIMLSGFLPPTVKAEENSLAGKPFFVAHGTYDDILPISRGQAVPELLKKLGAEVAYYEYPMQHQVVYEELEDLNQWLTPRLG
jgi:phospholipase/carboxylesterase